MSAGAVHGLELLRGGYDTSTDVLVIGSGAGGAVAAANFAAAGRQVLVVEAGVGREPEAEHRISSVVYEFLPQKKKMHY